MSAPAVSWCDPAGGRPAQVRSSVRLVASVAWSTATLAAKRTQRWHGVWDGATKDQTSQGPRGFIRSKGTCAAPLCEVRARCRGLRPHHVQRDRTGSWEVSCLAAAVACGVSNKGKEEGDVHLALPPHQHRSSRGRVLRTQG